ncbi:MAG: methyltransferase domain-containing protein [Candidatus Binatia bacterium]
MNRYYCRFCHSPLHVTFVDLGMSPLCESYVTADQCNRMEAFYPLHVYVCDQCFLVQLLEYVSPRQIFSEYAYFSSYSTTWLQHAKAYTEMAVHRFGLSRRSQVIEIASNDGYLLQYFVAQEVPVLGIEPAANVAAVATQKGIPTVVKFFGTQTAHELAHEGTQADLLLGNNVLAHVPDINDFVAGMKILLKPQGVITMEFPHLLRLMQENQFDTIYHEHFSYLSFSTTAKIFAAHGLTLFDVEELPTHGGSLRIYARHADQPTLVVEPRVTQLQQQEEAAGLTCIDQYRTFTDKVQETKRNLLEFLITAKRQGKTIVGYGAPGKGNTLLNYCGVRTDFLEYVVDRSPYKQGKFLPGTHIPIFAPERIAETKPDYVLILPWNLKHEVMQQMSQVRQWGGQFVVPIPTVEIYS